VKRRLDMCYSDSETVINPCQDTTSEDMNPSGCVTVNCKLCRSAIALQLIVVLSGVHEVSINPIIQSKPRLIVTTLLVTICNRTKLFFYQSFTKVRNCMCQFIRILMYCNVM
jgi:hypothetical protein